MFSPLSVVLCQQTYPVINTLDSGTGSLRAAIDSVNASENADGIIDHITFNISGTDTAVIVLSSDLPLITEGVIIDGLTQTGATCEMLLDTASTQPSLSGLLPTLRIVIRGAANTTNGIVLGAGSSGSLITGIAFQNLQTPLRIQDSDFHTIRCNYFGFSTNGLNPEPNNGQNIVLENADSCLITNNLLGASSDILPGDLAASIVVGDENSPNLSSSNRIVANVIGSNIVGEEAGLQKIGVSLRTGQSTEIHKNLIGFNKEFGIQSSESDMSVFSNNTLIDNGLGISDVVGAHISVDAFLTNTSNYTIRNNKIQETLTDSLNTAGILLLAFFQSIDNINIQDNELIGTTTGILIQTIASPISDVSITGNIIREQKGLGIALSPQAQRVNISNNSIYNNGGLAISLAVDNSPIIPTINDFQDLDIGANGLQNYPVIDSAKLNNDSVVIYGQISTSPSTTVTLDFYSNLVCNGDADGVAESNPDFQFGEGRTYLGSAEVPVDTSATASFQVTLPSPNPAEFVITSTATSMSGTSEFSRCATVTFDQYTVINTNDSDFGSLRFAVDCIQPGGSITFAEAIDGDTIKLTSDLIHVDKNLFIVGNGTTATIIDASSVFRAFEVASATDVTITDLTILGGTSTTAGGIMNEGMLLISHLSIIDNDTASDEVLLRSIGSGEVNIGANVSIRRID